MEGKPVKTLLTLLILTICTTILAVPEGGFIFNNRIKSGRFIDNSRSVSDAQSFLLWTAGAENKLLWNSADGILWTK